MDPFPREEALALLRRLPAYGRLALQLGRDPDLPVSRRGAVIGAAAYLLSPIDAVPGIIPVLGQLDDLVIIVAALRFALAGLSAQQRRRHLVAAGLSESVLTADERALVDVGAWTVRAATRTGARVGRVAAHAAVAGTQRSTELAHRAIGAAVSAIRSARP